MSIRRARSYSSEEMNSRAYTFVSTFSGAGGFDLGFADVGFACAWACDLSDDAAATHARNLHGEALAGDIEELQASIPTSGIDVVIGGPPCQGFSRGGHMNRNDPRSRHVWTFLSIVEQVEPAIFVMENVATLATNPRWEHVVPALCECARQIGYQAEVWVLDAADYGVPQRRQRMFLVGSRVGAVQRPVAHDRRISVREALSALPPAGCEGNDSLCTARVVPATNPVLRPSPYAGMLFNGQGRVLDLDAPSLTIPASMGGNRTPIIDQAWLEGSCDRSWIVDYHRRLRDGEPPVAEVPPSLRRLTVEEAQVLQGFPSTWKFCGEQSSRYRQIGNAVPPPLGHAIARSVRAALDAAEHEDALAA